MNHPRLDRSSPAGRLCTSVAAGITLLFGLLLLDLLRGGASRLSLELFTEPVLDAGRRGGLAPVLVSTFVVVAVALAVVVPLGLGTALHLAEVAPRRSPGSRLLRFCLDILASVPTIVFGLFGAAFFSGFLGLGFSLLSGGLTLACMVLPLVIRLGESSLRAIPREYREGAAALGLGRVAYWRHILLPWAAPGLVAAFLLALARMLAGAAALLFTAGYVTRMPGGPLDPGRVLSVHIYDLSTNVPGGDPSAHAAALVLLALLLLLGVGARSLGRRLGTEGGPP